MSWILILTLLSGVGVSVTTVEFVGQQACEEAKAAWLESLPEATFTRIYSTAVCVSRSPR